MLANVIPSPMAEKEQLDDNNFDGNCPSFIFHDLRFLQLSTHTYGDN